MATDPVSAFLRGFAIVDRLETNRQLRDFREEQQSRLRTVWDREDELWARNEKAHMQQEFLQMFDASTRAVLMNKKLGPEQLNNTQFILNEALKRTVAMRPEFGEATALAFGVDPQAGALVRNKQRPVSGVGIDLERGMFWEVDSVNGQQPLTVNRTDSPNDPVFFGQPDMTKLIKVFGPGIMNSDLFVAQMLRDMFPATGAPLASQDQRAAAPTPSSESAPRNLPPTQDPDFLEFEASPEGQAIANDVLTEADRMAEEAKATRDTATQNEVARGEEEIAPERPRQATIEENLRGAVDFATGGRTNLAPSIRPGTDEFAAANPPDTRTAQERGRDLGEATKEQAVETFDFLDQVRKTGSAAIRVAGARATPGLELRSAIVGFFQGVFGIDAPAEKAADVPEPNRRTSTASAVARDPEKAIAEAPPVTKDAAPAVAGKVIDASNQAAQRSGFSRPSLPQIYNAVGLAKAGILTQQQLVNYARTGRLDDVALQNLHFVQSGNVVVGLDKQTGQVISRTTLPTTDTQDIGDRRAIFNFVKEQTEHEFIDRDGKVDKRAQGQFMDAFEEIAGMFGITQDNIARTDDRMLNSLARGARFVTNFDEDRIQGLIDAGNLDLNPFTDFEVPFTAGNVAVGAALSQSGIVDDKEAMFALRSYLKDLKPAGGLTDAQTLIAVERIEIEAKRRARESGRSLRKEREELIEEMIRGDAESR